MVVGAGHFENKKVCQKSEVHFWSCRLIVGCSRCCLLLLEIVEFVGDLLRWKFSFLVVDNVLLKAIVASYIAGEHSLAPPTLSGFFPESHKKDKLNKSMLCRDLKNQLFLDFCVTQTPMIFVIMKIINIIIIFFLFFLILNFF